MLAWMFLTHVDVLELLRLSFGSMQLVKVGRHLQRRSTIKAWFHVELTNPLKNTISGVRVVR